MLSENGAFVIISRCLNRWFYQQPQGEIFKLLRSLMCGTVMECTFCSLLFHFGLKSDKTLLNFMCMCMCNVCSFMFLLWCSRHVNQNHCPKMSSKQSNWELIMTIIATNDYFQCFIQSDINTYRIYCSLKNASKF